MKVQGSCHCGEITYEAEVDPNSVHICNCTDCQMLTSALPWAQNISVLP